MENLNNSLSEEIKLWQKLVSLYAYFFGCARRIGLFPYIFDPVTLELTPINSGFYYHYFLLNVIVLSIHLIKPALLFIINVITNFHEDQFNGAYFLQIVWFFGCASISSIMYGYVSNRKGFAAVMSSCIRLEREFILSK